MGECLLCVHQKCGLTRKRDGHEKGYGVLRALAASAAAAKASRDGTPKDGTPQP